MVAQGYKTERRQHRGTSVRLSCGSAVSTALREIFVWEGIFNRRVRRCSQRNYSLMTADQNGNTLKYDAWNRLVSVTNSSGQVVAEYTYDATSRLVTEVYPQTSTTKNLYYSTGWQVLEERDNGTAASDVKYQYMWSAAYTDAMVLRDTFSGGVLQANSRIYATHDADWNVTSLIGYNATTQSWGVVERFVYDSYGQVTVLSPSWTSQSDAFNWQYLHQGLSLDSTVNLYYNRARWYSAALGRFISQDPAGYVNGANTYQSEMSGPVGALDPLGLASQQVEAVVGNIQWLDNSWKVVAVIPDHNLGNVTLDSFISLQGPRILVIVQISSCTIRWAATSNTSYLLSLAGPFLGHQPRAGRRDSPRVHESAHLHCEYIATVRGERDSRDKTHDVPYARIITGLHGADARNAPQGRGTPKLYATTIHRRRKELAVGLRRQNRVPIPPRSHPSGLGRAQPRP